MLRAQGTGPIRSELQILPQGLLQLPSGLWLKKQQLGMC